MPLGMILSFSPLEKMITLLWKRRQSLFDLKNSWIIRGLKSLHRQEDMVA
jgi:hypothetical protein